MGALAFSVITLVDTDILIDASRKTGDALGWLQILWQHSRLAVSAITVMELIVGCCNKRESQITEQFLERFDKFPLDADITQEAINLLKHYRLSHGLAIPDALIAATALNVNQNFITKNQRDYGFIECLRLLPDPLGQQFTDNANRDPG